MLVVIATPQEDKNLIPFPHTDAEAKECWSTLKEQFVSYHPELISGDD